MTAGIGTNRARVITEEIAARDETVGIDAMTEVDVTAATDTTIGADATAGMAAGATTTGDLRAATHRTEAVETVTTTAATVMPATTTVATGMPATTTVAMVMAETTAVPTIGQVEAPVMRAAIAIRAPMEATGTVGTATEAGAMVEASMAAARAEIIRAAIGAASAVMMGTIAEIVVPLMAMLARTL